MNCLTLGVLNQSLNKYATSIVNKQARNFAFCYNYKIKLYLAIEIEIKMVELDFKFLFVYSKKILFSATLAPLYNISTQPTNRSKVRTTLQIWHL
jgi:hypothetical protein